MGHDLLAVYGRDRDDDRGGRRFSGNPDDLPGTLCCHDVANYFFPQTREYSADETGARMVGQP